MLDRLTIERLRAWAGDKPVLLALSGGGDSVALLHLLFAELGAERLRAAVVDHALREGSADDAAQAKGFAETLGVRADVLRLTWPAGANRAQQTAREARYRALCKHAREQGLNAIVAAHTADDQAETVLMRAARGSTWRGLAGIPTFSFAPVWPEGRGIALARPLLVARRAQLRAYLRERGAAWIEDPANANPAFERVRVRRRLRELERGGFDPERLVRLAARLRGRADRLDEAALDLIFGAAQVGHATRIDGAKWSGKGEVRRRALALLIAAASGAEREPSWGELEALECRVMRCDHRGITHSGVEFTPVQGGVELRREAGAVIGRGDGALALEELPLSKGVETVWDGRLSIMAPESGWRVVPARNRELAVFEHGLVRKRYSQVREQLQLRWLTADRIHHGVAPDINRAKP
jgi:tRNA(Ile)-lysidine synthase